MWGKDECSDFLLYYISVGTTKAFCFSFVRVLVITAGNKSKLARLDIQGSRLGVQSQVMRSLLYGIGGGGVGTENQKDSNFGNRFVSLAVF